ncbi:MAG: hypothetical protein ABI318_06920 [Chthoniobacteraceae bacterium]
MNRFILSILSLALVVGLSACDKNKNKPRQKPVQGPKVTEQGMPGPGNDDGDVTPTEKKKKDEVVDPTPAVKNNRIPPPPAQNPEYAIKVDGKPGYVKSPYDPQGRLIDVRGLPPGTEAECPYTRRTFLVPP